MNRDKEICEALGIEWKSTYRCEEDNNNPDYASDAGKIQLLREMEKREDWSGFFNYICMDKFGRLIPEFLIIYVWIGRLIPESLLNYILDITGRLRDAAIEWMRKEAT